MTTSVDMPTQIGEIPCGPKNYKQSKAMERQINGFLHGQGSP